MLPSEFPILRDAQYYRTLARDNRRQKVRRWVHHLQRSLELTLQVPRWHQIADTAQPTPTLSTCIITMNSAHRIQPLLEYARLFSDEIVVGVDRKTSDDTYEKCKGLADELFWVENPSLTCNAGLENIVERCHGQWILRLDDDEFPEPEWITLKKGILSTDSYTHYKLPRLHLSSVTPLSWVDDGYLYPDYQMRLFRNDPSLLSFPGAVGHSSIQCSGQRGKIHSIRLVHLNLAINPRYKREEKLYKYVIRHQGGWVHPVNEHALLFEDFSYKERLYTHPDSSFAQRLAQTVIHQRQVYEAEQVK